MSDWGKLYGVGVGPGDPELLTLKAVRALHSVGAVFAAGSTQNSQSISLSIVQPHLRAGVLVRRLDFPMSKGRESRTEAYRRGATEILEFLATGQDAAFLTLGDPLTYSTFIYLSRAVLEKFPQARVEIVPGVTSFQAAAAGMGWPLAEAEESLVVLSGAKGGERLSEVARVADNIVILKVYRHFEDIKARLRDLDLLDNSILISHAGLNGERYVCDLAQQTEPPPYLSLILTKTKTRARGPDGR